VVLVDQTTGRFNEDAANSGETRPAANTRTETFKCILWFQY
jgi:hypothetical protein